VELSSTTFGFLDLGGILCSPVSQVTVKAGLKGARFLIGLTGQVPSGIIDAFTALSC
jgi:hypothetical protein